MFARVSGTRKYQYLQLVENRRDGPRTIQRVVCTLGRVEELKASGKIDVLARSLARFGQQPGLNGKCLTGGLEGADAPTHEPAVLPPCDEPAGEGASGGGGSASKVTKVSPEAADTLRKCPIFSDLNQQQIAELSRLALSRRLESGQFLYSEGDAVECCYLIVSGMTKMLKHSLSGRDSITGIYCPGEVVGITAVFLGHRYTASVQAITETRVLGIKRADFAAFLDQYPELGVKIAARMLKPITRRRQAAVAQLGNLAVERMSYRLARVLFALFVQLGPIIPLTREEISEMAGTTPETVSRFVSRLKQKGIVDAFRGKLILLEQDKLRLLARV